jgi:3-phenylpropionate/trans-cinnamate dioxygenase ferredoxin reductase component
VKPPRSILIVGAGLAGARCAETLRAESYDGSVVLVGEEPIAPYERPALSKEFLAGERSVDELLLRPPPFWSERGIDLLLGKHVRSVDVRAKVVTITRSRVLEWDALVLATGARARRLPFRTPRGVYVLRTLTDATALRADLARARRIVVGGGGFVGAEVASTARALGLDVTVLEAGPTPFARLLGSELGNVLAARYRAHGVDLRTGTSAAAFRVAAGGELSGVALSDGTVLPCEVAVVAVGVDPAVELVPPEAAAAIHVCGDAAGGAGHWTDAATSGANAARRLLGLEPLPTQPPFFWSDQFGLRIQLVGDPRSAARVELEGSEDAFVAYYRDGVGKVVAALAANRPDAVGAVRRELALAA